MLNTSRASRGNIIHMEGEMGGSLMQMRRKGDFCILALPSWPFGSIFG